MKKYKVMLLIVLCSILTIGFTSTAYAATLSENLKSLDDGRRDELVENKYTHYRDATDIIEAELSKYSSSTDPDAVNVTVGKVQRNLSYSDSATLNSFVEAQLAVAKEKTRESVSSKTSVDDVKESISDMLTDEFNVKADTRSASEVLNGVKEPIGTLVGILAFVVIITMGLFTALDICYIVIPVFRGAYDASADGGSSMTSKTGKGGESKLRWISDDAVYAVKTATVEEGRSPLKVYAFKRMGAYILVAVVIFMLLTGNVQVFINLALELVAGAIELIQKLAS